MLSYDSPVTQQLCARLSRVKRLCFGSGSARTLAEQRETTLPTDLPPKMVSGPCCLSWVYHLQQICGCAWTFCERWSKDWLMLQAMLRVTILCPSTYVAQACRASTSKKLAVIWLPTEQGYKEALQQLKKLEENVSFGLARKASSRGLQFNFNKAGWQVRKLGRTQTSKTLLTRRQFSGFLLMFAKYTHSQSSAILGLALQKKYSVLYPYNYYSFPPSNITQGFLHPIDG